MPRPTSLPTAATDAQRCISSANCSDDTATLLRFIEEHHQVSQRNVEWQCEQLRKAAELHRKMLEDKIDVAMAELRGSVEVGAIGFGLLDSEITASKEMEGNGDVPALDSIQETSIQLESDNFTTNGSEDVRPTALQSPPQEPNQERSSSRGFSMSRMQTAVSSSLQDTVMNVGAVIAKEKSAVHKLKERAAHEMETDEQPAAHILHICLRALRKKSLRRALDGGFLDVLLGFMIAISTLATYVQLEMTGVLANSALGLESSLPYSQAAVDVCAVSDYIMTAYFLLDLGLRLYAFGLHLFADKMMVLDAVIVLLTAIDTYFLNEDAGALDLRFLRVMRYLKLLRSVRSMVVFSKLRVLIRAIYSCVSSFVWSMTVLLACQIIASMIMVQMLHDVILDKSFDLEFRLWLNEYFGSPGKSWWTMFEVTFSGAWPTRVRPLIDKVSVGYALFFALYIGGVVFAIVRVITALFLKETMEEASRDHDLAIRNLRLQKVQFSQTLMDIFTEADTSGDGMVSFDEFQELLKHENIKHYLAYLELDVEEARDLFDLLDDGDQMVSFTEFAKGLNRMKGQARAVDVYGIARMQLKLVAEVNSLARVIGRTTRLARKKDLVVGEAGRPHPVAAMFQQAVT